MHEVGRAASAGAWLRSAASDQRFDRPAPTMLLATAARSSARLTANGAPLRVPELVAFLRESLDEPTPTPTSAITVDTAIVT
jgi:hypothetical protein